MTLTEFLLARIAEDESTARTASASPWKWTSRDDNAYGMPNVSWTLQAADRDVTELDAADPYALRLDVEPGDRNHIARHDPARVLAECAAKRRVVQWGGMALASSDATSDDGSPAAERVHGYGTAYEAVLSLLAVPYDSHPDYDEAWRP